AEQIVATYRHSQNVTGFLWPVLSPVRRVDDEISRREQVAKHVLGLYLGVLDHQLDFSVKRTKCLGMQHSRPQVVVTFS
ncbi:hypothetical protein DD768_28780, partial [Escherichia coli]